MSTAEHYPQSWLEASPPLPVDDEPAPPSEPQPDPDAPQPGPADR